MAATSLHDDVFLDFDSLVEIVAGARGVEMARKAACCVGRH